MVLVLALVISGTWWLARSVQSPAQREAAAAAPSLKPVTVAVARGDLRDEITATATVAQASASTVALPLGEGRAVVTRQLAQAGQEIHAGEVVLHVNGRPLIALPGAFPAYRDLVEGDQGDDVIQLQQALTALGYQLRADGDFGTATASAVKDLYVKRGYTARTVRERASAQSSDQNQTDSDKTGTDKSDQAQVDGQADQKAATLKVTVPLSEVVYVPGLLQGQVLTALPGQGQVLDSSTAVMGLASGQTHVEAEMPQSTADTLSIGAKARATTANGEITLTLQEVRKPVASSSGSADTSHTANGSGPGLAAAGASGNQQDSSGTGAMGMQVAHVQMVAVFAVEPGEQLPATGTTMVLTIERTPAVSGSLLVPKRALVTSSDQSHTVLVMRANGTFESVSVTLTGCVGGQCAVESDSLKEGEQLRVDQS
ncbi:peptidoglycan-binding domain-containing protein [Actinomyces faecalis]|uniref:peptidoglycan-binding domain-containing protein n=1 Tax=Actinomyces faecalis TaxID=2722820 RepID=UPI00155418E5|nr:peptidoglycan-binding domain-containing protein [Actinomyces faecalis]